MVEELRFDAGLTRYERRKLEEAIRQEAESARQSSADPSASLVAAIGDPSEMPKAAGSSDKNKSTLNQGQDIVIEKTDNRPSKTNSELSISDERRNQSAESQEKSQGSDKIIPEIQSEFTLVLSTSDESNHETTNNSDSDESGLDDAVKNVLAKWGHPKYSPKKSTKKSRRKSSKSEKSKVEKSLEKSCKSSVNSTTGSGSKKRERTDTSDDDSSEELAIRNMSAFALKVPKLKEEQESTEEYPNANINESIRANQVSGIKGKDVTVGTKSKKEKQEMAKVSKESSSTSTSVIVSDRDGLSTGQSGASSDEGRFTLKSINENICANQVLGVKDKNTTVMTKSNKEKNVMNKTSKESSSTSNSAVVSDRYLLSTGESWESYDKSRFTAKSVSQTTVESTGDNLQTSASETKNVKQGIASVSGQYRDRREGIFKPTSAESKPVTTDSEKLLRDTAVTPAAVVPPMDPRRQVKTAKINPQVNVDTKKETTDLRQTVAKSSDQNAGTFYSQKEKPSVQNSVKFSESNAAELRRQSEKVILDTLPKIDTTESIPGEKSRKSAIMDKFMKQSFTPLGKSGKDPRLYPSQRQPQDPRVYSSQKQYQEQRKPPTEVVSVRPKMTQGIQSDTMPAPGNIQLEFTRVPSVAQNVKNDKNNDLPRAAAKRALEKRSGGSRKIEVNKSRASQFEAKHTDVLGLILGESSVKKSESSSAAANTDEDKERSKEVSWQKNFSFM